MSQIIFTGTSSGYPAPDKACSSFLIRTGNRYFQFDAGEGFTGSALKFKINQNQIDRIFLSHLHTDHVAGLFLEIQLMYLSGRTVPLVIYTPAEAISKLKSTFDMFYLFREKFPFSINFKPIGKNPLFRGKTISVSAHPNSHLA